MLPSGSYFDDPRGLRKKRSLGKEFKRWSPGILAFVALVLALTTLLLRSRLHTCQRATAQLQQSYDNLQQERSKVKLLLESREATIRQKDISVTEVNRKLQDVNTQLHSLQAVDRHKDGEIAALKHSVDELDQQLAHEKEKHSTTADTCATDLKNTQSRVVELAGALADKQRDLADLHRRMAAETEHHQLQEAECRHAQTRLQEELATAKAAECTHGSHHEGGRAAEAGSQRAHHDHHEHSQEAHQRHPGSVHADDHSQHGQHERTLPDHQPQAHTPPVRQPGDSLVNAVHGVGIAAQTAGADGASGREDLAPFVSAAQALSDLGVDSIHGPLAFAETLRHLFGREAGHTAYMRYGDSHQPAPDLLAYALNREGIRSAKGNSYMIDQLGQYFPVLRGAGQAEQQPERQHADGHAHSAAGEVEEESMQGEEHHSTGQHAHHGRAEAGQITRPGNHHDRKQLG